MVLIDMKIVLRDMFKGTTGRFQRSRDGQFAGKLVFNGEEIECWLVFDDHGGSANDSSCLKLSFTNPFPCAVS